MSFIMVNNKTVLTFHVFKPEVETWEQSPQTKKTFKLLLKMKRVSDILLLNRFTNYFKSLHTSFLD